MENPLHNASPTGDHKHDWRRFWQKRLGKPVAKGVIHSSGWARREFEHGTAVYNPMGNDEGAVKFNELRTRLSNNKKGTEFTVPPLDGDLFLKSLNYESISRKWLMTFIAALSTSRSILSGCFSEVRNACMVLNGLPLRTSMVLQPTDQAALRHSMRSQMK